MSADRRPRRVCGISKPTSLERSLLQGIAMNPLAGLLAVAPSHSASTLTGLDWLAIGLYFSVLLGVAWWVIRRARTRRPITSLPAGTSAGGSSAPRSSPRTSARSTSSAWPARGQGRSGHGPLRTARLVPAGAGVGVRPLLRPLAGVHHAGVPRKAVFARLALRPLRGFAHHLRCLEDRRGHFRRRHRLRHAAARREPERRRHRRSTASGSAPCW